MSQAAATCGICGSDEIGTDEVFDRGLWRLSECGRCAHRWTEGPFGPPPRPVPVRRARRPGLGAAVA